MIILIQQTNYMFSIRFFVCLIILIKIESISCDISIEEFCSQGIEDAAPRNEHIIPICRENNNCARMFNIRPGKANETVFGFLTVGITRKYLREQTTPLKELLCTGKTFDQMNQETWLLTMMANKDQSQRICGAGQNLEVQPDGKSECVFDPTSNPSGASDDLTLLYLLLGALGTSMLFVIICLSIPMFNKTTWGDFTW